MTSGRASLLTRATTRYAAGAAIFLLTAAAGCGEDFALEEDSVSITSALDGTFVDFQDGTGTISVRVRTCSDTPVPATTQCAYCVLDEGWAMIGGGAQIIGESNPGAMLQASFPSEEDFDVVNSHGCFGPAGREGDFSSTWVARSSGANHVLRTYVIGIQVRDTPTSPPFKPATTAPVGIDRVTDMVSPPAEASVETTQDDIGSIWLLVGGGAEILNTTPDITLPSTAYLTESRMVEGANGRAWRASARSQTSTPQGALKSYGIGLAGCPGWSNFDCFTYPSIRAVVSAVTSGYATSSYTLPASWAQIGVGGRANRTSGGGRYLADLIPFNGSQKGFTVRSKANNSVAASGSTYGQTIALGRTQAPYTFNAIRFNVAGTALYRPTGTNPRLRQSTLYPNAAEMRWHLEHMGSGVYRVRNGNPDSGTQCAYRATDGFVRVNTCGSGNEFRWTALSGTIYTGPFQLRNVASGQCLDNNNLGWADSDLVLKTCSSGSAAQILFLDAYSWPPP